MTSTTITLATSSAPQGLDGKNGEECTQGGFWWSPRSQGRGQGSVVAEEQNMRHGTLGSSLCAGASLGAGNESPEAPRAEARRTSEVKVYSQATSPDSH